MILISLIVTSFLDNISIFADIGPNGFWPCARPLNYEKNLFLQFKVMKELDIPDLGFSYRKILEYLKSHYAYQA